jgi:hypothetical protein
MAGIMNSMSIVGTAKEGWSKNQACVYRSGAMAAVLILASGTSLQQQRWRR